MIYFIAEDRPNGKIKIGTTKDVEQRIIGLQTGSPYPLVCKLKLNFNFYYENWFHQMFEQERLRAEWFDNSRLLALFLDHPFYCNWNLLMNDPSDARKEFKRRFIQYKRPTGVRLKDRSNPIGLEIRHTLGLPNDIYEERTPLGKFAAKVVCKYIYFA